MQPTNMHTHTHTQNCFQLSTVRGGIQMFSFDCQSPKELDCVSDLYQIECEMTSNVTLNCESHADPCSFSPMTSCTLFHHERPLTLTLSCVQAESMSRVLFYRQLFYLLLPLLFSSETSYDYY